MIKFINSYLVVGSIEISGFEELLELIVVELVEIEELVEVELELILDDTLLELELFEIIGELKLDKLDFELLFGLQAHIEAHVAKIIRIFFIYLLFCLCKIPGILIIP